MDRYDLAREFELAKFELAVMKVSDVYELQTLAIRLFSETIAQRHVYEDMLRDTGGLPPRQ